MLEPLNNARSEQAIISQIRLTLYCNKSFGFKQMKGRFSRNPFVYINATKLKNRRGENLTKHVLLSMLEVYIVLTFCI